MNIIYGKVKLCDWGGYLRLSVPIVAFRSFALCPCKNHTCNDVMNVNERKEQSQVSKVYLSI